MIKNLNGTEYFYIKDLQGSITDIVDKDGNKLVSYEYDAYCNIFNIADSSGIDLGHINPYRYDEEIGWYYLNSRYYSPQWGRFISEDGQINNGVLGTNMYDYSVNNPVNYKDLGGNACYFDHRDTETSWVKEGECGGRFGKNLDAKTINDVSNTGINSGKGTVNPSASYANSYGAYTVGTEQTRVPNDFKRVSEPAKGWKVGDPINNYTRVGKKPSWTTVQRRFWKNEARFNSNNYTKTQLGRMTRGLAPKVQYTNGNWYSMELHHPSGRKGKNFWDFTPMTPWEHSDEDPYRFWRP